jgi:hypothetical protein
MSLYKSPGLVPNSDQEADTLAEKHEVELLKIIHSVGAPNGSFQLLMSWAQAASTNGYDFQPMPKQYE